MTMLEDSLTLPTLLVAIGAALVWTVGWTCLIVGAVQRKGRAGMLLGGAAIVQVVGGPLAVAVTYWTLLSWTQRFGAEAMAGAFTARLAPAALVLALVVAVTDVLVWRATLTEARSPAPARPPATGP